MKGLRDPDNDFLSLGGATGEPRERGADREPAEWRRGVSWSWLMEVVFVVVRRGSVLGERSLVRQGRRSLQPSLPCRRWRCKSCPAAVGAVVFGGDFEEARAGAGRRRLVVSGRGKEGRREGDFGGSVLRRLVGERLWRDAACGEGGRRGGRERLKVRGGDDGEGCEAGGGEGETRRLSPSWSWKRGGCRGSCEGAASCGAVEDGAAEEGAGRGVVGMRLLEGGTSRMKEEGTAGMGCDGEGVCREGNVVWG